jgi:hypothetical protein
LSDDTIVVAIAKESADYDTRVDALIELKKADVSEAVIQKILAAGQGEKTPAATPPPSMSVSTFADQTFPSIAPPLIEPAVGKEYFLRSTMHFEDGKYFATNYARGPIAAINTRVKLEKISGKAIVLKRLDTGESLKIENVDKYTHKTVIELARLLFSEEKTSLEKLPPDLADSIRNGEMRRGMNREQVLMARGYPPAHETPSIDGEKWVYWSSRFVKQTIIFVNDRLAEGRGLY